MTPKEPDSDFLLTRPEEIRSALFELTHPDCQILVRDAADREMAVVILGVDKQTGNFFWRPRDFAGDDFVNNDARGLRVGMVLQFNANGYGGVQIHFRVPRPELVKFDDGSAALVSPFPERMSRIQRRKMFRASIAGNAIRCAGHWRPAPAMKPIVFTVRDLSVDGVGLRINRAAAELPPTGAKMEDVYLDFGDFGNITTNLEVRTVIPLSGQPLTKAVPLPDSGEAGEPTPLPRSGNKGPEPLTHMGLAFVALDGRQETWLQQVVWRLEKARSSLGAG